MSTLRHPGVEARHEPFQAFERSAAESAAAVTSRRQTHVSHDGIVQSVDHRLGCTAGIGSFCGGTLQ